MTTTSTGLTSPFTYIGSSDYQFPNVPYVGVGLPSMDEPFIRDNQVLRFSGDFLVPLHRSSEQVAIREIYLAVMDLSCDHFLEDTPDGQGQNVEGFGTFEKALQQVQSYANPLKIRIKQGTTCIEGGNCFLFKKEDCTRVALVGELSVAMTFRQLFLSGHFQDLQPNLDVPPSEHALRIARNLDQAKAPLLATLAAPVTKEQREALYEDAKLYDACLMKVRSLMAEDLEVQSENLILIPQELFHIDMDTTVTPHGTILINSHNKVLKLLRTIDQNTLSETERAVVKSCIQNAEKDLAKFGHLHKARKQIFKQHGLQYKSIPGIFNSHTNEQNRSLSGCNGIYFQGHFVTTSPAPEEQKIYDLFSAIFKEKTGLTVVPHPQINSAFVAQCYGGVHCLTVENRLLS